MNRPTLEVADIIRQHGKDFIESNRSRLTWQQLKVLRAMERCRTAALGGHLDRCSRCGHRRRLPFADHRRAAACTGEVCLALEKLRLLTAPEAFGQRYE